MKGWRISGRGITFADKALVLQDRPGSLAGVWAKRWEMHPREQSPIAPRETDWVIRQGFSVSNFYNSMYLRSVPGTAQLATYSRRKIFPLPLTASLDTARGRTQTRWTN